MPATNPKVVPLFKPKDLKLEIEIARLKAYIRAIDPVIQPITQVTRKTLFQDGFIPGFVLIQMMRLAKTKKTSVKDRLLSFVNLGVFGGAK